MRNLTWKSDPPIAHGMQWAHIAQKRVDEWKIDVRDDVRDEPILAKTG